MTKAKDLLAIDISMFLIIYMYRFRVICPLPIEIGRGKPYYKSKHRIQKGVTFMLSNEGAFAISKI